MRSHTGLGEAVHLLRADLDLDWIAKGPEQRRVQRLVAIGLGNGDVILELAVDRFVERVQRAERQIARRRITDHHTQTVDVHDLTERHVLVGHLAVDAVERLFATTNLGLDTVVGESPTHRVRQALQGLAAAPAHLVQLGVEHAVTIGVEVAKREVLEFVDQSRQAQTARDWCVDVQRLGRHPASLFRLHCAERTHIVQAVSQLDQDDADIARHRQQHLAEVLSLRLLARSKVNLVELGDALDQIGDLVAEARGQFGAADASVFNDVV